MSDFLFKLESHLTPPQRDVVGMVEAAAAASEDPIFLAGGAMRDVLGGFLISDLDFVVQGDPEPLVNHLTARGATVIDQDSHRNTTELEFTNGVTAEVAMSRTEQYPRLGAPPVVRPAPIHDDLLRRDFTMNSIALSLYPASHGLLLDPTNGQADIERRELRANSNQSFYDDPSRLLRLLRFRVRMGFEVQERTQRQYENAREAEMETRIPARTLFRELRALAGEVNLVETVSTLSQEGLLTVFSPALKGANLNLAALGKLEKALQAVPFGANLHVNTLGLFMLALLEKLAPRERTVLLKNLSIRKKETESWSNLAARSTKLETDLKSKKLRRASDVYLRLRNEPGESILFLYLHSGQRIVHDRIRNYLQKHLLTAMEVTDRDVAMLTGIEPGGEAFDSAKEEMIAARLDGRKWEPPTPPEPKVQEPLIKKAVRKRQAEKKAAERTKGAPVTKKVGPVKRKKAAAPGSGG